jgi:hypothetical protein
MILDLIKKSVRPGCSACHADLYGRQHIAVVNDPGRRPEDCETLAWFCPTCWELRKAPTPPAASNEDLTQFRAEAAKLRALAGNVASNSSHSLTRDELKAIADLVGRMIAALEQKKTTT